MATCDPRKLYSIRIHERWGVVRELEVLYVEHVLGDGNHKRVREKKMKSKISAAGAALDASNREERFDFDV